MVFSYLKYTIKYWNVKYRCDPIDGRDLSLAFFPILCYNDEINYCLWQKIKIKFG
jgi:hypothetical protein